MKTRKKGFYWHVHHTKLLEYCYDAQERTAYILKYKPPGEIPLRLRLFQPVKGRLPKAVIEAGKIFNEAKIAWDKAVIVRSEAGIVLSMKRLKPGIALSKARIEWDRAYIAVDSADIALNKACIALNKTIADNMPAIEALHAKECPNCSWNGRTVFEENKT